MRDLNAEKTVGHHPSRHFVQMHFGTAGFRITGIAPVHQKEPQPAFGGLRNGRIVLFLPAHDLFGVLDHNLRWLLLDGSRTRNSHPHLRVNLLDLLADGTRVLMTRISGSPL